MGKMTPMAAARRPREPGGRASMLHFAGILLALAVALAACGQAYGMNTGFRLYGAGSVNAKPLFDAWTKAYRFARDDVSFEYSAVGGTVAVHQYKSGELDWLVIERAIPPEESGSYGNLVQFPVAGNAVVLAYNVSSLSASDPKLVLDRETVGRIWAGSIYLWNDSAIQRLNPGLAAKLPAEPIFLGYCDSNNSLSTNELTLLCLESFSSEFKEAFAQAHRIYGRMEPALRGTAISMSSSTADARAAWLQSVSNSMTFMPYWTAVAHGYPWVNMINRAGNLVEPDQYAVASAMNSRGAVLINEYLVTDIYDSDAAQAWPLSTIIYFSISKEAKSFDCTNVQEQLNFVSWIYTNDAASDIALNTDFVPLNVTYRKPLLDRLTSVRCEDNQAVTTPYLIGLGGPLSVFSSWSSAQSSSTTKIKYYVATSSTESKRNLQVGYEDFGVIADGLTEEWRSRIEDAALMPAAALAIGPGYNLPELRLGQYIVLNLETVAAIYLNEITMWNDPKIMELNPPDVAALLPERPIIVIIHQGASVNVLTAALRMYVPRFREAVPEGDSFITFPVQYAVNRSIVVPRAEEVLDKLRNTPYGLNVWYTYELDIVRGINAATLINPAGMPLRPTIDSVQSALTEYAAKGDTRVDFDSLLLGSGNSSWPLAAFASFIYRQRSMENCEKAAALADYLYWTQSDSSAQRIAQRQRFVLATIVPSIRTHFLNLLANFTCNGTRVSSVANCIADGRLCSDAGTCVHNACQCNDGLCGNYCEKPCEGGTNISLALGISIPGAMIALLLCLGMIICTTITRRRRKLEEDWEIDASEIDVREQLGSGGYGEVYKAIWKGTEVAVKFMLSDRVSREMERNFHDEVRVMTSLRHPNVVLFMAASTKPPRMCIVMEYMALGSLYDLLHNAMLPEIDFQVKVKMANQAAKGMYFLHSSGIVHRDLKSLNLLLDNKWNVKVSDFGLTKFKEDLKKSNTKIAVGSVNWMAPEVIMNQSGIDFEKADVYSFGIVLWELLTRKQPYDGMCAAAVAVNVVRDDARPLMPNDLNTPCLMLFGKLIRACWDAEAKSRPTFLDIMEELHSITNMLREQGKLSEPSSGDESSTLPAKYHISILGQTLSQQFGSSSSFIGQSKEESSSTSALASIANPTTETSSVESTSEPHDTLLVGEDVAIVITDIVRAGALWDFAPMEMKEATLLYNQLLRSSIARHDGHEATVWDLPGKNGGTLRMYTGEGTFCVAFASVRGALAWCAEVQIGLAKIAWPSSLLAHPAAAEGNGFQGPRVRMGMAVGPLRMQLDPRLQGIEFVGAAVTLAARAAERAEGGQILITGKSLPSEKELKGVSYVGTLDDPSVLNGIKLYQYSARKERRPRSKANDRGSKGEPKHASRPSFKDDDERILNSANTCRWIFDGRKDVLTSPTSPHFASASQGSITFGWWQELDVAIKVFAHYARTPIAESALLQFRAEAGLYTKLSHPNVVRVYGACVRKPNLCVIMERVSRGSLRDVLANCKVHLPFRMRIRMMRAAATGLHYLHSFRPGPIIHGNLKSTNILVDDDWNVKLSDFGFLNIKHEGETLTGRCGSPAWTAPELLSTGQGGGGEEGGGGAEEKRKREADERSDVYSLGMVMWEVATRSLPYAADRPLIDVALAIVDGRRPPLPSAASLVAQTAGRLHHRSAMRELFEEEHAGWAMYLDLVQHCWKQDPSRRPTTEMLLNRLDFLEARAAHPHEEADYTTLTSVA